LEASGPASTASRGEELPPAAELLQHTTGAIKPMPMNGRSFFLSVAGRPSALANGHGSAVRRQDSSFFPRKRPCGLSILAHADAQQSDAPQRGSSGVGYTMRQRPGRQSAELGPPAKRESRSVARLQGAENAYQDAFRQTLSREEVSLNPSS